MPYKKTHIGYTLYSITCLVNNKMYIGVTTHYDRRVNDHKYKLYIRTHKNNELQKEYDVYGADKFEYDLICQVENKFDAHRLEKYYTDYILCMNKNLCYNVYNGGLPYFKFGLNIKRSEDVVEKNRVSHLGIKQSLEARRKRSNSLKGRYFSDETKQKIRESSKKYFKKVIDTSNGKVYMSLVDANADFKDVGYATLYSWMQKPNRNKTTLRWLH